MDLAVWPSGKAVDCKSSIPSSNLGAALKTLTIILFLNSNEFILLVTQEYLFGNVVESVDTSDLKSGDHAVVRVQVPPFPVNFRKL